MGLWVWGSRRCFSGCGVYICGRRTRVPRELYIYRCPSQQFVGSLFEFVSFQSHGWICPPSPSTTVSTQLVHSRSMSSRHRAIFIALRHFLELVRAYRRPIYFRISAWSFLYGFILRSTDENTNILLRGMNMLLG